MSKDETYIERQKKINIAFKLNPNAISPALFQYLGYRQRVAEQILHSNNDQEISFLNEKFDYLNNEISNILGL